MASDQRQLEKTKHKGIYRREGKTGERYIVTYRDGAGKQRRETCRTLTAAVKRKKARDTDVDRGEHFAASQQPFADYATEWVERHQGRGGGGFRESSRVDYRRDLNKYAVRFFGRMKLAAITPRDVGNYVTWLADESQQGKRLSDASLRNKVKCVRSCLATAVDEGLIRHNPALRVRFPSRPTLNEDGALAGEFDEHVRALTRDQLAAFLATVNPRHRLLFRLLATTGLRISEALGLQWRHVHLDGSTPHVRVTRQFYKGAVAPPKSKASRRKVPLAPELVLELRWQRKQSEWPGEADPVFSSQVGGPLSYQNLYHRTLKPTAEEVGVSWVGFHTFRHTAASMLFERGANPVQVQRWLGHSSPRITMDTYIHLLSDDLGEPLSLADELSDQRTTEWTTTPTKAGENGKPAVVPELASTGTDS